MVIDVDPVLLHLGPLALRWYGLMYVVGIFVGLRVAIPYARAADVSEEDAWAVVTPGIIAGLVGGRLYFVVQSDLGSYLREPWRIFALWEGGMAFYGAVLGAVAAIVVVAWRRRLPLATLGRLLDAGALFAAVGQAFGRIGNIINGDIVGPPTDLPWGVVYENPGTFAPQRGVAYQPAAVYELLFNLLLIVVLWRLRSRLPRPGLLFVTYLALYSLGQLVLFNWRLNDVVALGLKQAQLTALAVLVLCLPLARLFWQAPQDAAPRDRGGPSRPERGRARPASVGGP